MNRAGGSRLVCLALAAGLLFPLGMASQGAARGKAIARTKPVVDSKAAVEEIATNKAFGSKGAPLTVEEFSDFECPACRQLYLQTLRSLIDDYVANGKVYLIHHDFPLPSHKYSHDAARYANAAARIGRFEKVEEALFDKQPEWAENGNVEAAVASVLTPTEMKRVQQLLHSSEVDDAINRDVALGQQFQVRQTPTMIVTHNGQKTPIVGVVNYSILRMWLDQQLRGH